MVSCMGHGHSHGHDGSGQHRGRLAIALAITLTVLAGELIGAALTGSLALLADAGHMAVDSLGLVAALTAAMLARRPPDRRRTFGFARAEVIAAGTNAVVLLVVAVFVTFEAISRLDDPPDVPGSPLLVLGVVGLVANLIALRVLSGGDRQNINLRGALLEVLGDALGSVAVIVAAVAVLAGGAEIADPIASLVIAALIAPRAGMLLREVLHVLLESAPAHLDTKEIYWRLRAVPGVADVHDLHLWTISSGRHALSAHLVVDGDHEVQCGESSVLDSAAQMLSDRFDLTHSTLQIENLDHADHEHTC